MRMRLEAEGTPITATLDDNPTARDFASLLPLTLTLEDYAATEKIAYLPRKLSTAGAPDGTDAAAGHVCYYAPWGNLAIFYRPSGHANGLVRLGAIREGIDVLLGAGPLNVKFELLED